MKSRINRIGTQATSTLVGAFLVVGLVVGCALPRLTKDVDATEGAAAHATSAAHHHAQSPIDIPNSASALSADHRVELHYHQTAEHIVHRQHTIEIEVKGADGNGIDFDGETYLLDQFHFHTPSEHLVAGQRFPIELHLVHRNRNDEVLVVGVLFQAGEASLFLEQILRDAPVKVGRVDRDAALDVSDLFPDESHFYSYRGSFTTPPYTEGVDWLVLRSHPEASNDQIVRLLVLEGGNARDVQDRNDRAVEGF
jgi:carbonic anhydrase